MRKDKAAEEKARREMRKMREYRSVCIQIERERDIMRYLYERGTSTVGSLDGIGGGGGISDKVGTCAISVADCRKELKRLYAKRDRIGRHILRLEELVRKDDTMAARMIRLYVFEGMSFAEMERMWQYSIDRDNIRVHVFRAVESAVRAHKIKENRA